MNTADADYETAAQDAEDAYDALVNPAWQNYVILVQAADAQWSTATSNAENAWMTAQNDAMMDMMNVMMGMPSSGVDLAVAQSQYETAMADADAQWYVTENAAWGTFEGILTTAIAGYQSDMHDGRR
ncbi:MAG: hypothetical protein R3C49_01035 [Planctomycetaceae bacterium]